MAALRAAVVDADAAVEAADRSKPYNHATYDAALTEYNRACEALVRALKGGA
jgi:hypothetical protein